MTLKVPLKLKLKQKRDEVVTPFSTIQISHHNQAQGKNIIPIFALINEIKKTKTRRLYCTFMLGMNLLLSPFPMQCSNQ
ncbi:hypothetical protein NC651_025872 [Populus alba x Populus x berolinensis]|nr:hypothetical protein NC651_025872 [Populus alba x Populus x berolinensis]